MADDAAFHAELAVPPEQREKRKQLALEECSAEELALLTCYRGGSFGVCTPQRQAFWACFRLKRGFEKTVLDAALAPRGAVPHATAKVDGSSK